MEMKMEALLQRDSNRKLKVIFQSFSSFPRLLVKNSHEKTHKKKKKAINDCLTKRLSAWKLWRKILRS